MKRNEYRLSTSLDGFLNESKTFMLKRGYGSRKPVVVGAKGNVRDQVLPFVNENRRVTQKTLKRFIAGLNETSRNPVAAANMWLKRNAKYFITESRNGVTYFKLSKIGSRLMNRMRPIHEQKEHDFVDKKKGFDRPGITSSKNEGCDKDDEELEEGDGAGKEIKTSTIEKYLAGKKKRMHKKSEWANLLEGDDDEEEDEEAKLEESIKRKRRVKKLLEAIKAKRSSQLFEGDDEEEEADEDELTFDDLDLGDEGEGEEGEEGEDDELEDEAEGEGVDNVEIAEFILTVDDSEAAIAELEELGIEAEIVEDEIEDDEEDLEGDDDLDFGDEGGEDEEGGDDLDFGDEDEEGGDDLDFGDDEVEESIEGSGDLSEDDDDLDFGDEDDEGGEDEEGGDDLDFGDEDDEGEETDEEDFDDVDMGDEGEEEGQKIKVGAEHAEELVKWLEEKGVDIEEMFGGELEIEGDDEDDEGEEPAEDIEDAESIEDEEDEGGEEDEDEELV